MTRKLDEGTAAQLRATLMERFGDPIVGDGQGVPSSGAKKDMGNRGFGAKTCECGGIMGMDEAEACTQCGMMAPAMDEDVGGRHPGHAASCTCPDCSRPAYTDKLGK